MLEFLIPFFFPAIGAGVAWLLGYEVEDAALVAFAVFGLQVLLVVGSNALESHRPSGMPPCRCGTKRFKKGRKLYTCRECGRRYDWHRFAPVWVEERFEDGRRLPYMRATRLGTWKRTEERPPSPFKKP